MPTEKFMRQHYGASGYVPPDDVCSRCRQTRAQHFGLNFADGQHVSGAVLICPTAVFFTEQDALSTPDRMARLAQLVEEFRDAGELDKLRLGLGVLSSPVYPTAIHSEEIITIDEDGKVSANGRGLGPLREGD